MLLQSTVWLQEDSFPPNMIIMGIQHLMTWLCPFSPPLHFHMYISTFGNLSISKSKTLLKLLRP
jgi:hypothetical protein